MRLHPSDPSSLPDLLGFLREHGCIAYPVEGTDEIAAMVPDVSSTEEARVIRGLVERWRCVSPLVAVEVSES